MLNAPDPAPMDPLHAGLLERLRAIPGVQDAALATAMPLVSGDVGRPFEIEGTTSGLQDRTDFTLGAARRNVLWLVLRSGLKLFLLGILAGGRCAALLGKGLAGWTSDLRAPDVWTIAWIGIALMVPGIAACWIPARRVLSLDPMAALRAP